MLSPTDLVVAQLALRMTAAEATRHVVRRRNHMELPQDRGFWPMHGTFMRRVPFETALCKGRRSRATPQTRGLSQCPGFAALHNPRRAALPFWIQEIAGLFSASFEVSLLRRARSDHK